MTGSVATTGSSGTYGVGPTGSGAEGQGHTGGDDADLRPGASAFAHPVRRRPSAPPFCLIGLHGSIADPLGTTESRWMDAERRFLVDLCDGDPSEPHVIDLVNQVQQTWMIEQPDPAPLVGLFGVALGDLLIARVPEFAWCQIHDEIRHEIGLTHAGGPVIVFPLAATAQYWEAKDLDWLTTYLDEVQTTVNRLALAS